MKFGKETTEARLECKEQTSEDMESGEERREVPKERAALQPVGGRRKRHRGQRLAVGHCGQPKERTQGNCGSRRKLVAPSRGITRRAGVARRKVHSRQEQGRDNFARGTPK
jgi:hypothetical protein